MTSLLFAALMAAGAVQSPATADQPAPDRVGSLSAETTRRFVAAAAAVTTRDDQRVLLYDFATRCTLQIDVGTPVAPLPQRLLGTTEPRLRVNAPYLVRQGISDLERAVDGAAPEDPSCEARIEAVYGSAFDPSASEVGAIARHAISVLKGAPLNGPGSTLTDLQKRATELTRKRLADKIASPLLLSVIRSDDKTILVLGEPASAYRWLAQYRNLPNGRWQFEGGYDAALQ